MPLDVNVTDAPPRSGTIQEQVTPEVLAAVKDALEQTRDDPRKVVTIGGKQPKEGTARTIVEAVMRLLAQEDPPVYVRTHVRAHKTDDGSADGYTGSVSLTPDGKPSRKKRSNGNNENAAPATTPAEPAPAPAEPDPAPAEPAAAGRRNK